MMMPAGSKNTFAPSGETGIPNQPLYSDSEMPTESSAASSSMNTSISPSCHPGMR